MVLGFLVANGIEKERLVSVGKGENSPIASNSTKEGRYQNPRVKLRTVETAFIKQEKPQSFCSNFCLFCVKFVRKVNLARLSLVRQVMSSTRMQTNLGIHHDYYQQNNY